MSTTRIRVRFRKRDEDRLQAGFIRELTATRITITSDRALRSGTRILVEVPEPPPGFFLEGEVERSLQVPQNLRKVRDPMMVVRILRPEELLSAISPDLEFRPYVITKDAPGAGPGTGLGDGEEEDVEDADGVITAVPYDIEEEVVLEENVFPIRYPHADVFHRALKHAEQNALLIPTPFPAAVGKEVELRIEVMGLAASSAAIRCQVVQHVPPSDELPAGGMAVVFLNPRVAIAELRAMSTHLSRQHDGSRWRSSEDES